MIEMKHVSFRYGRGEWVFRDLSLTVEKHRCTFLVGRNGSGKTTLGKLMTGILKPVSGTVLVDGLDTVKAELHQIGARVGYLFQEPERQLFAPTVWEELTFVLDLFGIEKRLQKERAEMLLEQFHLQKVKNHFTCQLSRGEKQRLALAAIMVNNPHFLILDEPTTGLDPRRREALAEILARCKAQGTGMVVISLDKKFTEKLADRIITLSDGGITDGY